MAVVKDHSPAKRQKIIDLTSRLTMRRYLPSWRKVTTTFLLAALGALAGKIIDYSWTRHFRPIDFEVDPYFADTRRNVGEGTLVDLGIPGIQPKQTNPFGKAVWQQIDPKYRGREVRLEIKPFKLASIPSVNLEDRRDAITVLVERDMKPIGTTPLDDGKAVGSTQTIKNSPIDVTKTYQSGPQQSGMGKNFSQWYRLCSEPLDGYVIKSETFVLVGDRQCNRWSECRLESRTPDQVCYQFRMQGHEEWTGLFNGAIPNGNNGQAASEGILTVIWTQKL